MSGLVVALMDRVNELAENPAGDVTGVRTGYYDLDSMTAGLQKGDLIVLAARPSMGKTAFALNIAEHVCVKEELPVLVFSMEMGAAQLALRLVGSLGRINQQNLRTGRLADDEWGRLADAVEKLGRVSMFIDETAGLSVAELRARARRMARQFGGTLGLIVVDYLQLMSGTGKSDGENRATEISEISRGLKALAKELQCPLIALSQLNRSVESRTDKRPMMSDLRESGAIEQDADRVVFLYRDDYYNKDSNDKGLAEVLIERFAFELADAAGGLVWEHYTEGWSVDWDYNRDNPGNIFKPWGFQTGHQTEWAKLLLIAHGHRPQQRWVDRAAALHNDVLRWAQATR
jgi:replicative DNA helicase